MSLQVLVTGCCGTVGRHVTRALLDAGHRVHGVSLEDHCLMTRPGFDYTRLDIADELATTRLLAETQFDAVLHFAALVHVKHKHFGFAEYNRVNNRASETLFWQAAKHGTRRFVFTSTIEVYGSTAANRTIDENEPCRPESDYARTKLLAEEALCQVARTTASQYAILRLAPVYAADFLLNLEKRLYLRRPVGYRLGRGEYQLALCSAQNIGHFATRWLAQEHPKSGVFNLADARTYSIKELLHRECLAGHCKVTLRLPYTACLVGAGILEAILSIGGRETGMLSASNVRKLVRSSHWDTRRATESIGPLPWTLDDTLAHTLDLEPGA